MENLQNELNEVKSSVEQQFSMVQRQSSTVEYRVRENQSKIQALLQYSQDREEAIKRVPANVDTLL